MDKSRYSLAGQSLLYVAAGVNHFVHKAFYLHIMPDHYAHPGAWVQLTGVAEIAGGVGLLVPATRRAAAGGLVLMLVGFLDVHIYMLRHPNRFPEAPLWLLWARLPLQALLIAWAGWYARQQPAADGQSRQRLAVADHPPQAQPRGGS